MPQKPHIGTLRPSKSMVSLKRNDDFHFFIKSCIFLIWVAFGFHFGSFGVPKMVLLGIKTSIKNRLKIRLFFILIFN